MPFMDLVGWKAEMVGGEEVFVVIGSVWNSIQIQYIMPLNYLTTISEFS